MRSFAKISTILLAVSSSVLLGQQPAAVQTRPDRVEIRTGPVYVSNDNWPEIHIAIEPKPRPGDQSEITFSSTDLILLEEDKQTVAASALEHFEDRKEGMAIALAIDVSGSMKGEPLNAVRQGLIDFVKRAREYDSVSIASFADDIRWETSWGDSQSGIQKAIENLQPRGTRTSLYDAIQSALVKFDNHGSKNLPIRRRVIVISDGFDEGSKITLDKLIANAKSDRIQIDSIGIAIRSREHVESLQRMSEESRGVFREASSLVQLKDQIGHGIERLLRTPVATFNIDTLKPDGKLHTLGVLWKKTNSSDTVPVMFPKAEWWTFEGRLRAWQTASLGGVLCLAVGLLFFMKTRSRRPELPEPSSMPKPGPKVAPHATTQVVRSATRVESGTIVERKPTILEAIPPSVSPNPQPPGPVRPAEARRTQLAPIISEPKPGRPVLVLRAFDGPLRGSVFPMETVEFWIGASENNHLRIANDNFMSGNHCCIRFEQQVLRLYDNGATNKTFLNGEALGDTARMVKFGDRIQTGNSIFVVEAPIA